MHAVVNNCGPRQNTPIVWRQLELCHSLKDEPTFAASRGGQRLIAPPLRRARLDQLPPRQQCAFADSDRM